MGRLENIVERNRNPGRHRKEGRFPFGIAMAAFVLLILILMIFTDLDESPDAPPAEPATPASRDDGAKKRVDGVLLYREKPRAPAAAGSAATP